MNTKQLEILQITQAMFNAAPGAQFLSEFSAFIDNGNASTKQLANALAETTVFKQSMYLETLNNTEFATQFVDNIVEDLVSAENKAWAVTTIESMLVDGQSRGDVIHWAATALVEVDTEDANWGEAALQFNNKVEVASFYSIDQDGAANTLAILQQVTANVTNIADTVTAAISLLETGVSGSVIDGYVSDATIFADLNGDGILNDGEVSTTTDEFGNFTLLGVAGFGNLIASGGTDIATGKPLEGNMTAPSGSTVVNPLTTLIDKITQDGTTSVDQATATVLASLGLDGSVDLLNYDPIAESVRTDTDTDTTETGIAIATQSAAAKINILISQTAALLDGAGISVDEDAGIESAYAALAATLTNTNAMGSIDLASVTVIEQVIQLAAEKAGADSTQTTAVQTLSTDASQTISNLNTAIDAALTNNASIFTVLVEIAAIQIVAEDIEAAIETGAAAGDISSTITSTTGTALTNAVTTAKTTVGDITSDGSSTPAIQYLATNATAFTGTAANDVLSISTADTLTPLVMTAVDLNGGTGTNTLSVQDGSSIAAAMVSNFTELTFDTTGVAGTNDVTMTAAQYSGFSGTITAAGTGSNGENITLSDQATALTLNAAVETFTLGNFANSVTMGAVGQIVTGNAAVDTVTAITGVTSTSDLAAGANVVVVTDSANISAGTFSATGGTVSYNVDAAATGTLTAAQAALISSATGTQNITLSDQATALTLNAAVETFTLGDFANSVTMGAVGQIVTGNAAVDTVTAITGVTSTSDLAAGANVVVVTNGANISAGTFSATGGTVGYNVDAVATGTLTAAQAALISSAAGTQNITLSDQATALAINTAVETFTLGNFANSVTMGAVGQIVTGNAAVDTVTAITGVTSTSDLAAGANVVVVTNGANISGGTFSATGGTVGYNVDAAATGTLTVAQAALISSAAGTQNIKLSNVISGAATLNAAVETFTLAAGANSVTVGAIGQTINADALLDTEVLTLAGTQAANVTLVAGDLTSTSSGNTIVTATTGTNIITLGAGADTITGGGAADTIVGGSGIDTYKWTATTAAQFATETGSTAGTNVTYTAGSIGDEVTFVSAEDKLNFSAAAVTNAIGTETDTLLSIAKAGTVADTARFVHITDTTVGDNVNTGAGAVTVLNGLTTTAVAIGDSFIAAMDDDTSTYLYYVNQVSVADTIAAQDVTLIGVLDGITSVADGDFVSF